MKKNKDFSNLLNGIKLVITDVDGVLTDGGLYYDQHGMALKKFNVKDGMGVRLLKEKNIKTAIITTDNSDIVKTRAERIKVDYLFMGVWDKENKMKEICQEETISTSEVAFIGDDVNDLGIISEVGISACPADAVAVVKEQVDIILSNEGGKAVFREFTDLIIKSIL